MNLAGTVPEHSLTFGAVVQKVRLQLPNDHFCVKRCG